MYSCINNKCIWNPFYSLLGRELVLKVPLICDLCYQESTICNFLVFMKITIIPLGKKIVVCKEIMLKYFQFFFIHTLQSYSLLIVDLKNK